MEIKYEIYDYGSRGKNAEISRLYKDVFGVCLDVDSDICFNSGPYGSPVGIMALTDSGEAAGHFATMCISARSGEETVSGRMSFGFMVGEKYRGLHIASTMSEKLFAYLRQRGDSAFVIGFPNENSYHLHTSLMGYEHLRDYQMVCLPRSGRKAEPGRFQPADFLTGESGIYRGSDFTNSLIHSEEQLNWKFADGKKYRKFVTEDGKFFVVSRYQNSTQIVCYSRDTDPELLTGFADFLYDTDAADEVRTWNSTDFLNSFPDSKRRWHMCINIITEDSCLRERLREPWFFMPGDTELF